MDIFSSYSDELGLGHRCISGLLFAFVFIFAFLFFSPPALNSLTQPANQKEEQTPHISPPILHIHSSNWLLRKSISPNPLSVWIYACWKSFPPTDIYVMLDVVSLTDHTHRGLHLKPGRLGGERRGWCWCRFKKTGKQPKTTTIMSLNYASVAPAQRSTSFFIEDILLHKPKPLREVIPSPFCSSLASRMPILEYGYPLMPTPILAPHPHHPLHKPEHHHQYFFTSGKHIWHRRTSGTCRRTERPGGTRTLQSDRNYSISAQNAAEVYFLQIIKTGKSIIDLHNPA